MNNHHSYRVIATKEGLVDDIYIKTGDEWEGNEKKDLDDSEGDGFVGFVHQVVIDKFMKNHETPERDGLYIP